MKQILITVHGIRTFGQWQERLGGLLRKAGSSAHIVHFKYGYFSSAAFLIPPLRYFMVRRFARAVMQLSLANPDATISFVAHSFGTHLVGWALQRLARGRPFPGDIVLLAGSVLKPTFPWNDLIARGAVRTVVNECGIYDTILVLNQLVALGTGMAGRLGFIGLLDDRFANNYFAFGHSGYFLKDKAPDDEFMDRRWVPLLTKNLIPDPVDQRVSGGVLGGVKMWLLKNTAPIKLAIYLSPLFAALVVLLNLYVGAVARQLSAEAASFKSERPDIAMLLAVESSRLRDNPQSRSALIQVLQFDPAIEKMLWGSSADVSVQTYDHSGDAFAVGDRGGCIHLYRGSDEKDLGAFCLRDHAYISSLAFTRDDGRLLIGDGGGRVSVWNLRSRRFDAPPRAAHEYEGDEPTLFLPLTDGKGAVSTGGDQTLKLWRLDPELSLAGSAQLTLDPVGLAVHPDGRHVIVGGSEGEVSVWNLLPVPHEERAAVMHKDYVSLSLGATGSVLATTGLADPFLKLSDPLTLADVRGPLPLPRIGGSDVAVLPGDHAVVAANAFETVSIFRGFKTDPDRVDLQGVTIPFAASPDGVHIAATLQDLKTAAVLNTSHPRSIGRRISLRSNAQILAVHLTSDGDRLVILQKDRVLSRIDLRDGRRTEQVLPRDQPLPTLPTISNDGGLLAAVYDTKVCIFSIAKARPEKCVPVGFAVQTLSFDDVGDLLGVGGRGGEVGVLETATGRIAASFAVRRSKALDLGDGNPGTPDPVATYAIAFAPGGHALAVGGSDGKIVAGSVDNGQWFQQSQMAGHRNAVFSMCFDATGKQLASASSDGTLRFWDARTGRDIGLPVQTQIGVQYLSCSADFTTAVVGFGHQIGLYDTASKIRLGDLLQGPDASIYFFSASNDASILVAASQVEVLVWDLRSESLRNRACAIVNRDISKEEWAQFVNDVMPYRSVCPMPTQASTSKGA